MTEELLQLRNIYKNFGNVKVLKDVNIKINKGEVVALIGDNGAGKSTLIKVDLPAPLSPIRATTSPLLIFILTSFKTLTFPKFL